MINRLTGQPCNDKWSKHQMNEGPAKRTAESHLPVVPEKLISPQPTYAQTKHQYPGQSLNKAKFQEGKDTKGLYATFYTQNPIPYRLVCL